LQGKSRERLRKEEEGEEKGLTFRLIRGIINTDRWMILAMRRLTHE
jgi:hypothetical protein